MSLHLKFFFSHLFISLLIALVVIGLVFFVWYPSPLAEAIGVKQIFLTMFVVDVIVGPLLSLFVYKEGKKTLKFDLSVIIFIQICALVYGVYTIAKGRPVWLVYNIDRIELVGNNEIIQTHIQEARTQFQSPSWLKPKYVGVEFAQDAKQRGDDMLAEILGGISIAQKPERYVEIEQVKSKIQQHAQDLALLSQYNDKALVQKILDRYPQANAYLPLKANALDMTVLVNKDTAEIIKIVDLRPWK